MAQWTTCAGYPSWLVWIIADHLRFRCGAGISTEARHKMSVATVPNSQPRNFSVGANQATYWLASHWLLVVTGLWALYVGLPWLAPVFMKIGLSGAGNLIYAFYSTQCHQLPQRSFFLFGGKPMYSLAEIQAAWEPTNDPAILRQFTGNAAMGWKVAWSDRMVSMYTSILVGGLIYGLVRRRLRPLPWWGLVLFILPMALDGGTHLISDFAGIGQGFRDSNAWLVALTGGTLPNAFYAGDALGSFNEWMRLLTGVLFGIGIVWLAYPYLSQAFDDWKAAIEANASRQRASREL